VVSNIFYFHPYLGKIPILTNIFQMGGNHQLDYDCYHVLLLLLLLLLLHKACMAYRLQCPNRAVAADFFVDELEGSAPHFLDHNLFFLSGLHKKTSNFIGF